MKSVQASSPGRARTPSPAASARDAGLRLVSSVNRWMIAGAVALTGAISLVAAKSFHGHTASASANGSANAQPSGSGGGGGGSSPISSNTGNTGNSGSTGAGLQQPSQAPASGNSAAAPVVSGGS